VNVIDSSAWLGSLAMKILAELQRRYVILMAG